MGKYDTDYSSNLIIHDTILRDIANEIAEANRLKRIEIEQHCANDHICYAKLTKEDLEDQA